MKAMVRHRYGPPGVLSLQDVDLPVAKDDDVLVRIRAASVNPSDWHRVMGTPYLVRLGGNGLLTPRQKIAGTDLSGQVESVGPNVTGFQPGDEVFGMCAGAFAEYLSVPWDRLALKPARLTFQQAAAVPMAGLTALQALRDAGQVQPGQQVLVNGASGGVGTFAVQLAKSFGAEVTGVCHTRNVGMVRALGAHHVIDYSREDFLHSGRRFDLIVDVAGNRSLADRKRAMTPNGTLVVVGGPKGNRFTGPVPSILKVVLASRFSSQRLVKMLTKYHPEDLALLRDLLEAGRVTPVIEKTFPLHEVPAALSYVGQGHARGKIVIAV